MAPRINLRLLVSLVLLALFAANDVLGAQLTPWLQGGELGVDLKGASLPPTIRKDLVSGLTNRIVIRVTLVSPGQPAAERLHKIRPVGGDIRREGGRRRYAGFREHRSAPG
jgi:hypothetical protein